MAVAPFDHFIFDEEKFHRNITSCMEFAEMHDALVTIGTRSSCLDMVYGYIQTASTEEISSVASFRERPDLKTGMSYLTAGDHLWNAGIFVWSTWSILAALERHLPEVYVLFAGQVDKFATPEEQNSIKEFFTPCPSISIAYDVLERGDNVFVRNSDFGWNDVGTWGLLYELSAKDADGNVVSAFSILYDTTDSLIKAAGKKVVW